MKVRTQQNFNRKTRETVFGISIMPDGGRRYCKYPIGHQEYKDYTQAHQAMKDVQKILDNGGRLVYSPKGSVLIAFGRENAEILRNCSLQGKYVELNNDK